MKSFVIVGLGRFGQCMLDSLIRRKCEVLVIDQDEDKIQWARDRATKAIKVDALNQELFTELLPDKVECAIVDLGDAMERSILVTNHLKKCGIEKIVVEAVNREHAEILEIVGATRIVYPEEEAAEHLAGLLAGGGALDFFAVSERFGMVEIPVPRDWAGKKPIELKLREKAGIELVAVRSPTTDSSQENWQLLTGEYVFNPSDIVIVAGSSEGIGRLTKD